MNINPRGALRPVRNERESDPDEEDSPSGHGLRGLSPFLGSLPEARLEIPGAHHEQEPRLDMEVGAEARSRPLILRRGSKHVHCVVENHISKLSHNSNYGH